jgi:exopolysaccharide biosynthesis protein
MLFVTTNSAQAAESTLEQSTDLTSLKQVAAGITYQRVEIDPRAIAHVVRIDTESGAWAIRPYMAGTTETTSVAATKLNALVAVNSGFFNLSDGESASYIFIDGKKVCEPKHNMALVNNKGLEPFLTRIFNRSELRFLQDKAGHTKMAIQPHSQAVPRNMKLVHSIQAGPQLLPRFTGREEAFIRRPPGASKDADSIGTSMRAARTAFGITGNGTAVIVCVQGKRNKEFAEGISLTALAEFMESIGCVQALNFDGGTSTTMVLSTELGLKIADSSSQQTASGASTAGKLITVVSSQPERLVKSIIYVTPSK